MDSGRVGSNTVKAVKTPGDAITATEQSNSNVIELNTTTGTVGFGCEEHNSSPSGIENTWFQNTGTGSPTGLCTYSMEDPT